MENTKNIKKLVLLGALVLATACGGNNQQAAANTNPSTTDAAQSATITPTTNVITLATDRNQPIATYNGYTIEARQFIYALNQSIMEQEQMFMMWMGFDEEMMAEHWASEIEDGLTNIENLRSAILDQVIEQGTMMVLAQRAGVQYDPELLQDVMASLNEEIIEIEAEGIDAYQLFFDIYGITVAEFEEVQRQVITGIAFVEYLEEDVTVTEAEVLETYEQNPSMFDMLQARASHVLIDTRELEGEDEIAEAYELATSILRRLDEGVSIEELARQYSQDPGSVGRGTGEPDGFYEFPRGMMVPEFEQFAFTANDGDTTIVTTTFGFHVMLSHGQDRVTDPQVLASIMANDELVSRIRRNIAIEMLVELLEQTELDWAIDQDLLDQIQ